MHTVLKLPRNVEPLGGIQYIQSELLVSRSLIETREGEAQWIPVGGVVTIASNHLGILFIRDSLV